LALGQLKLPYETIVDLQAIEELYTVEPPHEDRLFRWEAG
jgi:hypothetical protein